MNYLELATILTPIVIGVLAVVTYNQHRKIATLRTTLAQVRLLKRLSDSKHQLLAAAAQ